MLAQRFQLFRGSVLLADRAAVAYAGSDAEPAFPPCLHGDGASVRHSQPSLRPDVQHEPAQGRFVLGNVVGQDGDAREPVQQGKGSRWSPDAQSLMQPIPQITEPADAPIITAPSSLASMRAAIAAVPAIVS